MLDKVNEMIIGGGMAFTFLKVLNNMEVCVTFNCIFCYVFCCLSEIQFLNYNFISKKFDNVSRNILLKIFLSILKDEILYNFSGMHRVI